jgi:colanic acid biosynthesis glycosyl transferase WcaI
LKIYLITITYPPEIGGAAHLIHDLACSLQKMGHEITVVTVFPTYNLKEIPYQYRKGILMTETVEKLTIKRIRTPKFPRTFKLLRGLEHFIFGVFLSGMTFFLPKADAAIVFSPPLPLPWLVEFIGKIKRMKVVVNIQDLFPLEAVELGMLTNPYLIRLFEGMERKVYRQADAITVHSHGNKDHVLARGGREDRTHVVYNWVDVDMIQPKSKVNDFSNQYSLADRFVVSYAGTMGWAQDMSTIIACANRLRDRKEIYFILVGDGVEKEKAQVKSKELNLGNILWLPMQPLVVYPDILASSDISLINLHPELHTPVVPSKLLSIMAAGRAVVASLPRESDARQIIDAAGCGIYVDAGDDELLANAICKLESDRNMMAEMGRKGRGYIESHFSRNACTQELESVIQNA